MALTLEQIKEKYPVYQGVPDSVVFDDLHKTYYPNMPRAELAEAIGYKIPEQPKPAAILIMVSYKH